MSPTFGFSCENAKNPGGCDDFEVRFCCPARKFQMGRGVFIDRNIHRLKDKKYI